MSGAGDALPQWVFVCGGRSPVITADGFFDWAIRAQPRVSGGTNGGRNGGKGMIPHSAVGNWDTLEDLLDFLESRIASADPNSRSSWGATNMQDGIFYQHFSIWEQTWTSGSGIPNNNFFAFENAGGGYKNGKPNFSEPLTQPQIDNIIRVGRDLIAVQGWEPQRPMNSDDRTASLMEHNECKRFGSKPTACPSGRIPWDIIVPALKAQPEEDEMKSYLAWDTDRKRVYMVGPGKPAWITTQPVADELARIFGPLTVAMSSAALQALGADK
jgi:hypothetical protein